MARDRASRVGWKAKRASSYLLRIGRGWKAGWRAQHAAETGLARADRADVGARGRRDGARSGDRQDTKRTAYRWRDRYLASGVAWARTQRDASRPQAAFGRCNDRARRQPDAQREAADGPPIGRRARSPSGRPQPFERAAHLGSARAQTASDPQLQTVQRSQVLREGSGHRRALPRSARQGAGALGRREEPNPGA